MTRPVDTRPPRRARRARSGQVVLEHWREVRTGTDRPPDGRPPGHPPQPPPPNPPKPKLDVATRGYLRGLGWLVAIFAGVAGALFAHGVVTGWW